MKKWFLKVGVLFFVGVSVGLFGQQTAKKITVQTNQTIVDMFQIANGNNINNTVGTKRYGIGTQPSGNVIPYLESTGQTYTDMAWTNITPPTYVSEQIGNGTFEQAIPQPYDTSRGTNRFNRKGDINNTQLPKQLTMTQYDYDLDAQQDTDTYIDVLKSRFVLPHTYDDGSALPVGLHMIIISRNGNIQPQGWTHWGKRIGFRWNGTSRVQQTADPAGVAYDNLPDSTLWIHDVIGREQAKAMAYPNPSQGELKLNDGDKTPNELLDITVHNTAGQQVDKRQVREDTTLSLDRHPSGMYFINAVDQNGDKSQYKIVLKK